MKTKISKKKNQIFWKPPNPNEKLSLSSWKKSKPIFVVFLCAFYLCCYFHEFGVHSHAFLCLLDLYWLIGCFNHSQGFKSPRISHCVNHSRSLVVCCRSLSTMQLYLLLAADQYCGPMALTLPKSYVSKPLTHISFRKGLYIFVIYASLKFKRDE